MQLNEKYEIFENMKLKTMVIEIDITKTNLNFRRLLSLIQQLENCELGDYDLEVKDVYFK